MSDLGKTDIRHFQAFVFSHFTLIDAHLERLKLAVEEAYCCGSGRGQSGVAEELISKAYETFLQDFLSLYSTPRIEVSQEEEEEEEEEGVCVCVCRCLSLSEMECLSACSYALALVECVLQKWE